MTSAEESAAARHALGEVREAALGCVACKLAKGRTQVVFGIGNPTTPMVIVGQCPGEQEDQSGEPFVGPAGQLLTECLQACSIKRKDVWITNIVKCRPFERTAPNRTRNRDPEDDEIDACRPWIEAELALIRPWVIVCAGAPAANLILGRKVGITRDRGKWFTEHPYRPAHVIPVLHPAYILRHHGQQLEEMKQQLTDDLENARKMAAKLRHEPRKTVKRVPEVAIQPSLFDEAGD